MLSRLFATLSIVAFAMATVPLLSNLDEMNTATKTVVVLLLATIILLALSVLTRVWEK